MSDVSGTYEIVATTPMGEQKLTLAVKAEGDSFTGTSTGSMGSSDVSGRVAGNTLTWQQAITVPMPLTIDCEAVLEGESLSGTVKTGAFGTFPITGRKIA